MFGELYQDKNQPAPELLSDLTLDQIDYEWIENQKKASFLKKAIRLIEEDGDYYKDLKEACIQKLIKIDPSKAPKKFNNNVNEEVKQQIQKDIYKWEDEVTKNEKTKILEPEQPLTEEQKKRRAENEKNKGNEALKSKDFKEAIEYYTKSLQYDPQLSASYSNRALVYLKLKEYQKCITDCNKAIQINPEYTKAYHRRGKAKFAQDKILEAYQDFKFIMQKEPDNQEVNGDLKECQEILKKQNIQTTEGFRRIQIVEEDEDEDEEEEKDQEEKEQKQQYDIQEVQNIEKQKELANEEIKKGNFETSLKIFEKCVFDLEKIIAKFPLKEELLIILKLLNILIKLQK
ncbi:tpr domain conserved [Ichthyophthirius multifiliis]|uniref:Tpr domain conserved n=1 Tax=Ichthyophthirius multifiliis TaxID=5932 RepID=G0QL16_ICHMU|nr:tpr domain conserved [Ichthyophthirius multifiliis]EGR34072.1 tpr domain conserved [Ichthyophthirius multifiliis]|eukprot:XP_004039376.1 tpr domain conserved [Ichthyophthirius multifiliis]